MLDVVVVGCILFPTGYCYVWVDFFFFQAEDGIRYLVRSRGLGDVYKRQVLDRLHPVVGGEEIRRHGERPVIGEQQAVVRLDVCLLYTSDAADERSSVDLGGRRIIKKTNITIKQL